MKEVILAIFLVLAVLHIAALLQIRDHLKAIAERPTVVEEKSSWVDCKKLSLKYPNGLCRFSVLRKD